MRSHGAGGPEVRSDSSRRVSQVAQNGEAVVRAARERDRIEVGSESRQGPVTRRDGPTVDSRSDVCRAVCVWLPSARR